MSLVASVVRPNIIDPDFHGNINAPSFLELWFKTAMGQEPSPSDTARVVYQHRLFNEGCDDESEPRIRVASQR
jgi:hypothetical protein